MANESIPSEHRRYLPPELRTALGETDVHDTCGAEDSGAPGDVAHSPLHRFLHAAAWRYLIGGVSLLILLLMFGMMCSPVYWRF